MRRLHLPLLLVLASWAAGAASAQEQYGVVLRTTDGAGAHTDRIRIQSQIGVSRILLVDAYLDVGGASIINVPAPTLPTDAANKAYVDAAVGGVSFNAFAQVADSAGTVQFSASGLDMIRFSGGSGLAVTFNAVTKEVAYSIPAGAITNTHLAAGIDPAKITGTALTGATSFSDAAGSDVAVSGTSGALDLQLKPGSVTNADVTGPIAAAKIEDVWVNTGGDTMLGPLVANGGVAVPTGQQLRYRDALDANWALATTAGAGELHVDLTGESLAGEARAWRLRDLAGGGPTTRFSVDMLTGAVGVTGTLNMGSQKIASLADPTNPQEAATKNYVDGLLGGIGGLQSLNGQTGPAILLGTSAGSGLSITSADGGATDTVTIVSDLLNGTTPDDYVHWNVLAGIPAGFADGADDNTLYAAGAGLTLSAGNQFDVVFGIAAGTAAAGNHAHDADYVNVDGDTMTGPLGIGQAPAVDEKLIVVGSQGSIIIR